MPDTVCFTLKEYRDIVGSLAFGAEGLAAFETEVRIHARTQARYHNCKMDKADLQRMVAEYKSRETAKDYRLRLTEEERDAWRGKAIRRSVWCVVAPIAVFILTILATN